MPLPAARGSVMSVYASSRTVTLLMPSMVALAVPPTPTVPLMMNTCKCTSSPRAAATGRDNGGGRSVAPGMSLCIASIGTAVQRVCSGRACMLRSSCRTGGDERRSGDPLLGLLMMLSAATTTCCCTAATRGCVEQLLGCIIPMTIIQAAANSVGGVDFHRHSCRRLGLRTLARSRT
jgi:hypothetical protein